MDPRTTAAPVCHPNDDVTLRDAVLAHDPRAWTELLRRFRPLVFRCITRITGRSDAMCMDDAQEIFAELCCSLLADDMHKLRAWDPARGSRLSTWLGMLAVHLTYDHLRRHARRPRLERGERHLWDERASDQPSALDALMEHEHGVERARSLSSLLDALNARERRFVELYYKEELEPEAIARAMGISVKTVYSKKHKLRARLLELLHADGAQAELALAA